MTAVASTLREGWALAQTSALRGTELRVVSLGDLQPHAWAALDSHDRPGILVQVPGSQSLATTVAAVNRESGVIAAEIFPFEHEGQPARGLRLWCEARELSDVFVGFCEPFLERCRSGESVEAAFGGCMEEFRRLLTMGELSRVPPAVIGLIGELAVLQELVQISGNAATFWSYPDLDRHDFRNGSVAIEVKTSLRSRQSRPLVMISSLDQLEEPGGGALFLQWILLERDPAGAAGIDASMEVIASRIQPSDAAALWKRIEANVDLAEFRTLRFAVQVRQMFHVTDAFPRLTRSRLISRRPDPGIGRVSYELDLSTARAYECAAGTAYASIIDNIPPQ